MTEVGILIQGRISAWIKDIIQEYKTNFPEAKILLSTWNKENVDGIDCEVVQTEPPKPTHPHNNTTNHQIVGTKYGLSKLDSDIILKCRTDQFVHNKNIFKLYKENCPSEKIMVPDVGSESTDDYRVSDFCQIGTKKILQSFWGNIPLYDGTYAMSPEIYLAKNYVVNVKKDNTPWRQIFRKYFHYMNYNFDFQIEFEKLAYDEKYSRYYNTTKHKI